MSNFHSLVGYKHVILCSFCPDKGRPATGEIILPDGVSLPICEQCLDGRFAGIEVDTDADPE